jgi:hypothetical protein
MLKATPWHKTETQCHPGVSSIATRWLAVALAMVVLAACQHGDLTYSQSTGAFHMPLGAGSSNRND